MKNVVKLLGIIAITAVIVFSMASCGDKNEFIGTWSGNYYGAPIKLVCTETNWTFTMSGQGSYSGTYTYDGNTAEFTERGGGVFGTASVSKDTMTINASGMGFTLKKQ